MLIRLLLTSMLLATSALAESPVISIRREARGFVSAKPEEAEFTVVVTYAVPDLVRDSDTYCFKRFWAEVTQYADGSSSEMHTGQA